MKYAPLAGTFAETVEPRGVRAYAPARPVKEMSDEEFGDWLESLPPPPGLPATDEELAGSLARAEADLAAGRVYPHEVVSRWLETWGKPDFKPFEEWLESSG